MEKRLTRRKERGSAMSALPTAELSSKQVFSDFTSLLEEANPLVKQLQAIKDSHKPEGFTWHGYNTLNNFTIINQLLRNHRDLFARVHERPIADVGAADGDVAFVLEQLGFNVEIIDNPPTNWNGMLGAYRLKELLDSSATIREIDLDRYFDLPRRDYGLVIFLGVLYHLKNPFYVLERLAESTEYCLVSTRVARWTYDCAPEPLVEKKRSWFKPPVNPGQDERAVHLGGTSVAYLLDSDECNNDSTNFWIFSMPGLNKILKRTGWEILESLNGGDLQASNPRDMHHDERACLLLRSRLNR
jgi:tRNA (mo5U34)-methyltransferase